MLFRSRSRGRSLGDRGGDGVAPARARRSAVAAHNCGHHAQRSRSETLAGELLRGRSDQAFERCAHRTSGALHAPLCASNFDTCRLANVRADSLDQHLSIADCHGSIHGNSRRNQLRGGVGVSRRIAARRSWTWARRCGVALPLGSISRRCARWFRFASRRSCSATEQRCDRAERFRGSACVRRTAARRDVGRREFDSARRIGHSSPLSLNASSARHAGARVPIGTCAG